MKKTCFFFFLLFSLQAFSQKVVLKNNLVYDALLTTQSFCGALLGEEMDFGYPSGYEFLLL